MKICLIGSTRFMDEYRRLNRELTLSGHVVYSVATISTSAAGEHVQAEEQITEDQKMVLDLVHLRKIQESDAVVLVTDGSHYYGFSTRREIIWARMLQKTVYAPITFCNARELEEDFRWWDIGFLTDPSLNGGITGPGSIVG